MSKITWQSRRSKWILYSTLVIVFPNWLSFLYTSVHLGGDALSGYVEAGRYFLCSHGRCVEVAQAVWTHNYWQGISAVASMVAVFVEFAVLVSTGDIVLEKRSHM